MRGRRSDVHSIDGHLIIYYINRKSVIEWPNLLVGESQRPHRHRIPTLVFLSLRARERRARTCLDGSVGCVCVRWPVDPSANAKRSACWNQRRFRWSCRFSQSGGECVGGTRGTVAAVLERPIRWTNRHHERRRTSVRRIEDIVEWISSEFASFPDRRVARRVRETVERRKPTRTNKVSNIAEENNRLAYWEIDSFPNERKTRFDSIGEVRCHLRIGSARTFRRRWSWRRTSRRRVSRRDLSDLDRRPWRPIGIDICSRV